MPILETENARVAYMDGGSGEPVMALHASAGSGRQWKSLCQATNGRFYMIAPDLCGYGESDGWSGDGPLKLSDEVARLGAILDRLIEPVHLVGHSYGGAVALRMALEKPHRIRTLTLIEPVAFHVLRRGADRERDLFTEISNVAGCVSDAVVSGNFAKGMQKFIDYWSGEGTWNRIPADKQAELRKLTSKVALDFWASCTEGADLREYRQIQLPTMILRGSCSPAPVRRIAEMLTPAIPFAKLETIPGAGHMLPLTHSDETNARILRHLRSNVIRHRHAA